MSFVQRCFMATFTELICRKENIQKQFRVTVDICIQEWCDIFFCFLLFLRKCDVVIALSPDIQAFPLVNK